MSPKFSEAGTVLRVEVSGDAVIVIAGGICIYQADSEGETGSRSDMPPGADWYELGRDAVLLAAKTGLGSFPQRLVLADVAAFITDSRKTTGR